ncbi:nitrilotriacetate monooxygenase [Novosphingobium sp. FSY-8]|uniref:Nitrilotriacetate monooxygenase n=1 Tax=Novosphingobium ovatum TaxID=1908523 RepID=A0ABW9XBX7_9SPHN|nr:nitrilotriacetate monooxygenase [Novosphingobium ovatum]NBC36000.1 nitrilotriacetate monooxygenase [Novosphingobium ovatum]
MTHPFILSASVTQAELSDPAWAAPVLAQAQSLGLDMLLLGRAGAPLAFDAQVIAAWAASQLTTMGVVPVVGTGLGHPFHTARGLSAVDWLAGGMLGWNPAGPDAAQVADMARAANALWDGWSDDTLIIDKDSGRYLDTTKVIVPDYRGSHYRTRGPVNAMRPRQGNPVLVADADAPFDLAQTDISIAAQGQSAPSARLRLIRVGLDADVAMLAAAHAAGEIAGAHVDLDDAVAQLPQLAAAFAPVIEGRARATTGTLRQRLGLPTPFVSHSATEEAA